MHTKVKAKIPHGYYGHVSDKSEFSSGTGLFVGAGVVDSDFTIEIRILLFNPSPIIKTVSTDTVIAQLLITPIFRDEVLIISPTAGDKIIRPSARGKGLFGQPRTDSKMNIANQNEYIASIDKIYKQSSNICIFLFLGQ